MSKKKKKKQSTKPTNRISKAIAAKEDIFSVETKSNQTGIETENIAESHDIEETVDCKKRTDNSVENTETRASFFEKTKNFFFKKRKIIFHIGAIALISIIVSVITSSVTLCLSPEIKQLKDIKAALPETENKVEEPVVSESEETYNNAMKLIGEGKLEEAYTLLDSIDEGYEKAKYALNKFIKIPEKTTVIQGGQVQETSVVVTTAENYYKIEETGKNNTTGLEITQSQEVTLDDKGNKIKEVTVRKGITQTVERTFDNFGNMLTEKNTVVSTDQENPVDFTSHNKETSSENYIYYYVGK